MGRRWSEPRQTAGPIQAILAVTALSLHPASISSVAAQSTDGPVWIIQEQVRQARVIRGQFVAPEKADREVVEPPKQPEDGAEQAKPNPDNAFMRWRPDLKFKWKPAPSIESGNGRFEIKIIGRLFVDAGRVNDDGDSTGRIQTDWRSGRLGFSGKIWRDLRFRFEVEFTGDETNIIDANLQWTSPKGVNLTLGQFKQLNSFAVQSSLKFMALMERSAFTKAFGFDRKIGIGIDFGGNNWIAKFGGFWGQAGARNKDEGITLAGGVGYAPRIGKAQGHLGASFRYRKVGDNQSLFRYRARAYSKFTDTFIDTGPIAKEDVFFGIEAAGVWKGLLIQAEFGRLEANVASAAPNPTFSGGNIDISWFLTGERHVLDRQDGVLRRPEVNNPVFEGGLGAWEVAARFDSIDLTEPFFLGGEQNTFILGLNWYLNRRLRLMVNYSRAKIKQAFLVEANGPDGRNKVKTIGFRAQVDW